MSLFLQCVLQFLSLTTLDTYFGRLLNSQDRRPLLRDWLFNGLSQTESATVNLSS